MTIRRQQVRQAAARHRKRRKNGLLWRPILVTKSQLDQLEERGYLDPGRRDPLDECDAIASFLTDALRRLHHHGKRWRSGMAGRKHHAVSGLDEERAERPSLSPGADGADKERGSAGRLP
jgi:hypothetical protein